MITDEEILAEERLSQEREVLLYNISLRQDDMNTQSTDMPLSKLEGDAAYQEMIERGFLTYEVMSHGSFPVANLRVTPKGLRYCVLYSEEIEPNRLFDIGGNLRRAPEPVAGTMSAPQVISEGDKARLVFPSMVPTGLSDSAVGIALSDAQLKHIAELSSKRSAMRGNGQGSVDTFESEERTIEDAGGASWRYVVINDDYVRINAVETNTKKIEIPEQIDGKSVLALAAGSLSGLQQVEEIVCADTIETIGSGAFRHNPNLRRLVLPRQVSSFDSNWITQCSNLAELVLPGELEKIDRSVLGTGNLKRLVIGSGTKIICAGTFQGSALEEIVINEKNPFFVTDGSAIYSNDHKYLLALACPVEKLFVAESCEVIGEKCCHGFTGLTEVSLPDSIIEIGPFAFSNTGLARFIAPSSLKIIEAKAFFYCHWLCDVVLNDGLLRIGDSAFQGSGLRSLTIPSTVQSIGTSITKGTRIIHSGPECTFSVDSRSKDQFYDGEGGLYRIEEDGKHLVQLIDADKEIYSVQPGTVAIEPFAFAFHDNISRVRIPDSLRSIGISAFRVCKKLAHVSMPDSVEMIGDEAFFDTNLESFHIPANLKCLGERALVTEGSHYGRRIPSLTAIDVASDNDCFYMASGMLCRKGESGDSVVVYTGSDPNVVFPDEIVRVEDYAFNSARGIETLSLNPRLNIIGSNGLSTKCWIEHIHIELSEPIDDRCVFDFYFPNTQSGIRGIAVGLGGANWVNVPGIVEQLDICLANAHSYLSCNTDDSISAYEQARLILDRFNDPFMLTNTNRTTLERILRNNIVEISVDVALHDDRGTFDELVERGYVNKDNLDEIIDRVTMLRDAATSAHLLEAKRLMTQQSVFDYDL